jgi:histidinol-phosphate aminotransferase
MPPRRELPGDPFSTALRGLVPYEPGKPVEEVQRELGIERVVKLASNEGPYGPFPAALDAIARTAAELNRYPDGGAYRLREALADRHGVAFEEVITGAGADGLIDCLAQVFLEPGDEIVCCWPSFVSYVISARKLGATPRLLPLRDHRYDLEAMLDAIGPRTKLAYICLPNNPTGTMNSRDEIEAWFGGVPDRVVTIVDQAYFEYIDHPGYVDAVAEHFTQGRNVVVLRTFSKIYGLAGLRVGYAVAPAAVVTEVSKVRRAFDVSTTAQEAALASIGDHVEVQRRRRLNTDGRSELERALAEHGLEPVPEAVANFVFVELGEDARPFQERLLREGAIVRPTHGFGAPEAIRVTVGTPEEHEFLAGALDRVATRVA